MEQLKGILFIDIETVPLYPDYDLLPEGLQKEWQKKSKTIKGVTEPNQEPATLFTERAGIFSEFAKVVCIGIGSVHQYEDGWKMRLKSLDGNDEKVLLNEFSAVVDRFSKHHNDLRFCGHNIKEFDIPFLCRRMVINGLALPKCMQLNGKKPWEVNHLDTLELWRFGDYKNYTALSLLAEVLGIPSPKTDIDGSMVASVYWNEGDLARISKYCLQDVFATAQVYLRLVGRNDIEIEPVYVKE